MELELHGNHGELRAAYHVAARLPSWRMETVGPRIYQVEAVGCTVVSAWLGYRPLTLRVPVGNGLCYEFAVTGQVGPPDKDDEDRRMKLFAEGLPRMVRERKGV